MLFIDYDNLTGGQKKAGIHAIVTAALLSAPLATTTTTGRCEVRIYGGWYQGNVLTPLAQKVVAEVQSVLPTVLRCPTISGGFCSVAIQGELAFALSEEPSHHLFDTFRRKQAPHSLRCTDPANLGCNNSPCPLSGIPALFRDEKCPAASCAVVLRDVLYRDEQKLVDTMLTCDMLHATSLSYDLITVISGDDDLLPAIRSVALRGTPIVRLHPKPFQRGASFPPGGATFREHTL